MFVSIQLYNYGSPFRNASFSVSCGVVGVVGIGRQIAIDNLPWLGRNRVSLLLRLDDELPRVQDVHLQRYASHFSNGPEYIARVELDDGFWFDRLRSATLLTIELVDFDLPRDYDLPLEPVTIDLNWLFSTPLQEEIDNCGQPSVAAPDN